MEWAEVSNVSREWLRTMGNFSPTANERLRELKGYLHCDDVGDGRTYLTADELRLIAVAFTEAADWLDKRSEVASASQADQSTHATT